MVFSVCSWVYTLISRLNAKIVTNSGFEPTSFEELAKFNAALREGTLDEFFAAGYKVVAMDPNLGKYGDHDHTPLNETYTFLRPAIENGDITLIALTGYCSADHVDDRGIHWFTKPTSTLRPFLKTLYAGLLD